MQGEHTNARWFCSQIGAREHYAVPRVLHQAGKLSALYTDFWAGNLLRRLATAVRSPVVRSLASRFHPELEQARVVAWNLRSLGWELELRRRQKADRLQGAYLGFNEVGRAFAVQVRTKLKQDAKTARVPIFYAYDTGGLEALEWCRENRVPCVLNQMDPNRVEMEMVQREEQQWPGWTLQPVQVPEEYLIRRQQEWELADCVVVNSEFCRSALIQQGVPEGKLRVVPLCYEISRPRLAVGNKELRKSGEPLRVLYLGQVILRKGIQYLVEAARMLEGENIRFDVVGPLGISTEAVAKAPKNIIFHGRATRDQTSKWYRQSDVFVLPTLSDGFAITQIEAMANGLPVVATPNCGLVVTNELDGLIVPPRHAEKLAAAFLRYIKEPDLLGAQSRQALQKAEQFSRRQLDGHLAALGRDLAGG